ncbi:NAD-dependent glycerol-3-phosphate dehydrogenase [Conidiobolus coronatus NRRL 28638]|uniref:Glycerol-3-phosphate dehydrogenase [NAD(+)] n=1 Tax=Conidiobolus coronatus (strain ATCC 28846 / CBS 209.66 / NRRL 28638) TaxID=796925 RepID=A0A137NYB8_CONC2|nr:NAD-dependent glycerol-3-phosphate dehydrogenase [Conidiobolus coronatus NRRL 28638]|eukprot:KXN67661.1 NAD-dependent glycerol-3-phosphate dehydrogenase [Conidiobolus coronatus NRRL 28638]
MTYFNQANNTQQVKQKVCIVGSGNWGSTIAKIIGLNVLKYTDFDPKVNMWVFEENINGEKLTDIINTKHENVKYLPGIQLPENVVAIPDLKEAAKDATLLVFVVPHQFIKNCCDQLKGQISPNTKAISLIKGVQVDVNGIKLTSEYITNALGVEVNVLSGANIASEIALEKFCETTIGYRNRASGELFARIFHTPYFLVNIVPDVEGVEICGALKNVVAIAAGVVDGLKLGDNTKAAIIRIGLAEMMKFAKLFLKGVQNETFFESCGVADLITTCAGGRNRKVAEAYVVTGKSFEQLEKEMLNGQKLQGTLTSQEVYDFLKRQNLNSEFPLFTRTYQICYEGLAPQKLLTGLDGNSAVNNSQHKTPTPLSPSL